MTGFAMSWIVIDLRTCEYTCIHTHIYIYIYLFTSESLPDVGKHLDRTWMVWYFYNIAKTHAVDCCSQFPNNSQQINELGCCFSNSHHQAHIFKVRVRSQPLPLYTFLFLGLLPQRRAVFQSHHFSRASC